PRHPRPIDPALRDLDHRGQQRERGDHRRQRRTRALRRHQCVRQECAGPADHPAPRLARGRWRRIRSGEHRRDPALRTRPYRAPRWLPGPHAQTIYPSLFGGAPPIEYRRERWTTPDQDFIDLDFTRPPPAADAPWLVLFHGLEGSSQSHYARALMAAARDAGWQGVVPHFRGCSGEANLAPRAYHSGDSDEIDWIVRRLVARAGTAPVFVAGVSLGANALLKWLGERGDEAAGLVAAAAGISAPQDLRAGAEA